MARSDIFLRKNRVEVVGGGPEVEDGRERGDLEVAVGRNEDPSVTLNADRANVTLGGGTGKAPEGDLKLLDRDGANRVQISAESDVSSRKKSNAGDETVWIDGGAGQIRLAPRGKEFGTIEPSAVLDGSRGRLQLNDPGNVTGEADVNLDARTGDVDVGGPEGESGRIVLRDGEDEKTVAVEAESPKGKGARVRAGDVDLYNTPGLGDLPAGGVGEFRDGANAGVEVHGPSASIRLGYSYVETETNDKPGPGPGAGLPKAGGKPGRIFLDDGNVGRFGINQSTVFELRASEGKLQVATDAGRLFEINPGKKQLRIPNGWSVKDSLPTYSP